MKFSAFVKTTSTVHSIWRGRSQLSGMIGPTRFKLSGKIYVADDVDPDEVATLMTNAAVQVETIATDTDEEDTDLEVAVDDGPAEPPAQPKRRGRPPSK